MKCERALDELRDGEELEDDESEDDYPGPDESEDDDGQDYEVDWESPL
jgi:hypothetical protein